MSLGKSTRGLRREVQLNKLLAREAMKAVDEVISMLTEFGFEGVTKENLPKIVESVLEQIRPSDQGPGFPMQVIPHTISSSSPFANLHTSQPPAVPPSPASWGLKKPRVQPPPSQAPIAPDPVIEQATAPLVSSVDEAAFRKQMEQKLNAKIQDAEANGIRYRMPGSPGKPPNPVKKKMSLEEKEAFMRSIGQEYVAPTGNPTMKTR